METTLEQTPPLEVEPLVALLKALFSFIDHLSMGLGRGIIVCFVVLFIAQQTFRILDKPLYKTNPLIILALWSGLLMPMASWVCCVSYAILPGLITVGWGSDIINYCAEKSK